MLSELIKKKLMHQKIAKNGGESALFKTIKIKGSQYQNTKKMGWLELYDILLLPKHQSRHFVACGRTI